MAKRGNPNMIPGAPSVNQTGNRKAKLSKAGETIASIIDRVCSEGAAEEIEMIALAARGIMKDPHIPDTFLRVDAKTRAACATWIAEQRHGKARQAVDLDVSGRLETRHTVDLSKLAHDDLGALERLLEKSQPDSEESDAEVVDAVPTLSPGEPISNSEPASPEKNGVRND